jgi:membrane protein insertase Oxa1/YidC/SpoIIIJ
MVGLISLSFASGLSIYWVASNIVGIVQYAMMGQIDWKNAFRAPKPAPAVAVSEGSSAAVPAPRRQAREVATVPATAISKKRKLSETMQRPTSVSRPDLSRKPTTQAKSSKVRKPKK